MAYRRSIIARTKSFYQQQQRLAPSFSHISNRDREEFHTNSSTSNSEIRSYIHNSFLIPRNNSSNSQLSRYVFQVRQYQIGVGYGLVSHRSMSSASGGERVSFEIEALKNTDVLNDMVGAAGGKAVEVAPVMNEVAIAAADSFSPVAALQYLVDYVHCYTGFNWWASIVATTLLLHLIQLPFVIHLWKVDASYSKILSSINHQQLLLALKGFKWDDPIDTTAKRFAFFPDVASKTCITYVGASITTDIIIPCSFYFAILNMADKVPSFATGGTLWFTDLTSPDRICLPVLLALTLWIRFELATHKNISEFVGALALLGTVTVGFPKAIYFYWITANLASIVFSTAMMDPLIQKSLGVSSDKKTP